MQWLSNVNASCSNVATRHLSSAYIAVWPVVYFITYDIWLHTMATYVSEMWDRLEEMSDMVQKSLGAQPAISEALYWKAKEVDD